MDFLVLRVAGLWCAWLLLLLFHVELGLMPLFHGASVEIKSQALRWLTFPCFWPQQIRGSCSPRPSSRGRSTPRLLRRLTGWRLLRGSW